MFPSRLVSVIGKGAFENNYSLRWDGSNDYVDLGTDFIGTGDVTVSAWVYRTGDGYSRLIGNGKFRIQDNNGRIRMTSVDGTAAQGTSGALSLNVWEHWVVTRESDGTTNLYLNGSLDGSADQSSGTPASATQNLWIGMEAAEIEWEGFIDEVSIFNTILSSSDVSNKLRDGSKPADLAGMSGLVAWYRMGDGTEGASGTTVYDMSDNSNNGTMTNMSSDDFTSETP